MKFKKINIKRLKTKFNIMYNRILDNCAINLIFEAFNFWSFQLLIEFPYSIGTVFRLGYEKTFLSIRSRVNPFHNYTGFINENTPDNVRVMLASCKYIGFIEIKFRIIKPKKIQETE